ncbi:spore coat protein [Alkalihalobacillus sp. AL-G]|uniref:spore coat protein n=1 Tax=Alkalihalobacillus sp. AL-G TaxID=2926399 RepID=UPI00272A0EE6|nr:spore coat protein [Alkalihalobacillus sp. AL-G]WLD93611.1 spore coat protein [Alkalihalobacillus sp. AL-G]
MPNNMKNRGLTDREMLQLCLELEKGRCRSSSNALLETSHKELRDVYKHCFENAEQNQSKLFEVMKEKDWYKVEPATTEQIGKTQALMQNNLHPDDQF